MDSIQRFMFAEAPVRGEIVHLESSLHTIFLQHNYPEHIQNILGEALVCVVLMTNTIKFQGTLTLQFQSEGALKTVVAKCDHNHHIRGFVDWDRECSPEQVVEEFMSGSLVLTIAPEQQKPYQSIVPLQGKSIAAALEYYFAQTEQLATRLWCAVTNTQAAGMMLQLMPTEGSKDDELRLRENFWEHATKLGETITAAELLTCDNTTLLHRLYHQETIHLYDAEQVSFQCTCSQERMSNAVRMLGEEEAYAILSTNQIIEVKCEYCSNAFSFDKTAVQALFS